jgi:hypothetical protein
VPDAGPDPFGAAAIRRRVLDGWTAAPVRLREDANAEEDLALGGYRDRLLVELAQNAADAAAQAGWPGRLALTLGHQGDQPVLVAANTGAPLDAAGVQSLATLRASAKTSHHATDHPTDDATDEVAVGRFGVGFAAVLAVTDEPAVLSRTGGVRFSREDTAALLAAAADPALDAEVLRRDGHVPVLRLPFAAEGTPPDGYDTAVVLPLRDGAAADLVRAQLAGLDDALLLALPALTEIVIRSGDAPPRTLRGADERWWVHRSAGFWTEPERRELLADRPTEERRSPGWQVLWAVPRAGAVGPGTVIPGTVHAPTPTDEPLGLPALLLATFPLDPTRRHVLPGPLTDRMVAEAARGYAQLLRDRAEAGDDVLPLVPVGLAAGALDAAVRERVLRLLPDVPLLTAIEDSALLCPRSAVLLDVDAGWPSLVALAPHVAGLVAAPRRSRAALTALGVQELALADVVDQLPMGGRPKSWRALYDGLAPLAEDPAVREALAGLPVPLADGRTVRGPRGLLVGEDDGVGAAALGPLARYGLRVVHPDATHPLLTRLGASAVTARAVLDDPAVLMAIRELPDAADFLEADDPEADDPAVGDPAVDDPAVDDPEPNNTTLTTAVLTLVDRAVAQGALVPGELGWLADLALPDEWGEHTSAGALALPGSPAALLLDPDEIGVLDEALAAAWPRRTLTAVGVLDDLGVARAADVDLMDPPPELVDLDGFGDWAQEMVAAGTDEVAELLVVRDLDVARPDRWPDVVQHLASRPLLRRALIEPPVRDPAGLPSYTAWWLRRELALMGTVSAPVDHAPGDGPGDGPGDAAIGPIDDLGGLLAPAPAWVGALDPAVRGALGVLDGAWIGAAGGAPPSARVAALLLGRLADPGRVVEAVACLRAWGWLAGFDDPPEDVWARLGDGYVDGPVNDPGAALVRVLDDGGTRVVPAAEAVVSDDPRWLQRVDLGGHVVAPAGRGAALADLLDLDLADELAAGEVWSAGTPVPVPAEVRALLPAGPTGWIEHERLVVDDQEVDWWVDGSGVPHAATSEGLARALAWAGGRWASRYAVAEVLTHPSAAARYAVDSVFD